MLAYQQMLVYQQMVVYQQMPAYKQIVYLINQHSKIMNQKYTI